ncbi:hypothetical protein HMPREF3293_00478 [Christensenella minuta]|uniref:Uncharacterized protein n=1 Tax=Christensenella minuta TaxID=626937 RepID=A0A136Q7J2_9FIRM|nr:hypothetical protein HMPREF3293_00478 [Christensenella minuta]
MGNNFFLGYSCRSLNIGGRQFIRLLLSFIYERKICPQGPRRERILRAERFLLFI